jgi:SAM-dependent methyltransferase
MPPGFKPQELAARYNVEKFSEDDWHSYSGERTAKLISQNIRPIPDLPPLLLNAGAGVYELGIPGWQEIAVDLFEAPIRSRQNAVKGNIEDLQFPAEMFGAVVCVGEVLGYCDPQKVISEFGRVTVSSGILICDFSSTRSFRRWFRKGYGRAADFVTDQYNGSPEPIWIYHPSYIFSLLAAAGFRVKHTYGIHIWSALARRIGASSRSATQIQRRLKWLPIPSGWADVVTVVAVRI